MILDVKAECMVMLLPPTHPVAEISPYLNDQSSLAQMGGSGSL